MPRETRKGPPSENQTTLIGGVNSLPKTAKIEFLGIVADYNAATKRRCVVLSIQKSARASRNKSTPPRVLAFASFLPCPLAIAAPVPCLFTRAASSFIPQQYVLLSSINRWATSRSTSVPQDNCRCNIGR